MLTAKQYAAELQSGLIRGYAADFILFVSGWDFDLSPWRWADHQSIAIFKYCGKSLLQLAQVVEPDIPNG